MAEVKELRIDDIHLNFGVVQALEGVSLCISKPEIVGIIGPNGAGKTSLLNCINGFYRPGKGHIYFDGTDITHMLPHKIAQAGISRTFQNIELYIGMSVLNNIMAGRHILMNSGFVSCGVYFGKARSEELRHRKIAEQIIEFLEVEAIRKEVVGALPYGLRKKVELGRALALEPKLLLLDEPMAGMTSEEKEDMARFIIDIHELREIPIVLIEHDMGVVLDICDRICVLDFGRKIAEGTPQEVRVNPLVVKAYFGAEHVA